MILVVADASPLRYLIVIGVVDVLPRLFHPEVEGWRDGVMEPDWRLRRMPSLQFSTTPLLHLKL